MTSPMTLMTVMKRSLGIDKKIHCSKAFGLKWESEEEKNHMRPLIKFDTFSLSHVTQVLSYLTRAFLSNN